MKFHAAAVLVLVCLFQNATADDYWKGSLKSERIRDLSNKILQLSSSINGQASSKGTPEAWQCTVEASTKWEREAEVHRQDIGHCVDSETNEKVAVSCCNGVDGRALNRIRAIQSQAFDCIVMAKSQFQNDFGFGLANPGYFGR